jgi:hypothetical protein
MSGFVDLSVPLLVLSGPVRALMAPMAMRDDSYADQRLDLCCGQNSFALDFSAVLESGTKSMCVQNEKKQMKQGLLSFSRPVLRLCSSWSCSLFLLAILFLVA